jgi:hypothetical protein
VIASCFADPQAAVAAWVPGLLPSHDLPSVATAMLVRGMDGRSLLAGLSPVDTAEARGMFERAIQELGWKTPDRRSAAARYARCVSQLILKGEVTPYDGARGVWEACLAVRDTSFHDLAPFIYAGSEYRDRPKVRAMK